MNPTSYQTAPPRTRKIRIIHTKSTFDFQELFTYKPSIINALERVAYDNPIREALIDYRNAKHSDYHNLKALEKNIRNIRSSREKTTFLEKKLHF